MEYCCFNGKALLRSDFIQYGRHALSYLLVQVTVNAPLVQVKLLRAKRKPGLVLVLVLVFVWTQPNLSFQEGKFPSTYKAAIVTPVPKKLGSGIFCPANFQPISNFNNMSKILEKLFVSRLQPHVTSSPNSNQCSRHIDHPILLKLPCCIHWTTYIVHRIKVNLLFWSLVTIQYNTIQWKICTQKLTNTLSV